MAKRTSETHNIVAFSDLHAGSQLGLCPPGVHLDNGGIYRPSRIQRKMWKWWSEFWEVFVPEATDGEPYCVINVGDTIDGVHHKSVDQISQNLADQSRVAVALLRPVVERCEGRYFQIRGTEAHGGPAGEQEEWIAREVGAKPNSDQQYCRPRLYKSIGPRLISFLHHISTAGSAHYESTAVYKELIDAFVEVSRWSRRPIDGCVRAHRHRYLKVEIGTKRGDGFSATLPGWQALTPWAYRLPGARQSEPQFGGLLIHWSEKRGELFTRKFLRSLTPEKPE